MRPDDGPHDGAAEQQLDPEAAEQAVCADENGHAAVGREAGGELPAKRPEPSVERLGDPPRATGLDVRLAAIEAALAEMVQRLAGESERAVVRERVIDRQHEEIERLKSVERAGQLRPVVTDLCRLRNGLLRQAGTVPAEMAGPQVATLLGSFAADVAEALERCGIAVLDREVGTAFAPGRQQVAAVVETEDLERDGTVAEVVQDGYAEIDGGKVVAPARIMLHRYVTKEKTDG